jgi:sec-independent protein translocase protein TatC
MAKKPTDDLFEKSTMTFGEHLEELRVCLFRGVVGVAAGCLVGFFIANQVVRFFQSPLEGAMEEYYLDKALADYKTNHQMEPPLEVKRMVLDQGLVPEVFQMEPGEMADSLRLTYPERFANLRISPYWFTAADFLPGGALRLCRQLAEPKTPPPHTPAAQVWELLGDSRRLKIQVLAQTSGDLLAEQTAELVAALNDVAGQPAIYESPEFSSVVGPDASATTTWVNKLMEWFGKPAPLATDTVGKLRKELADTPDPEKTRRLNKLLIASAFPGEFHKARFNLLSVSAWRPVKVRFQVLNAQEAFMIWMKAALVTGLVVASPYLFYQIWIFVAAGLYPHEKNYVFLYLPISLALFFGGASLAFAFVFRPVLNFLFTFNRGMNADFDPRIGEWLSFVLILPLGFGISFQLPLVMLFLNRIGLVSLDLYVQQWRVAILTIFIIAMVLTPADPVSMLLMAGPLCFLYLLGILMCKYMPRGRSPFAEAYEP